MKYIHECTHVRTSYTHCIYMIVSEVVFIIRITQYFIAAVIACYNDDMCCKCYIWPRAKLGSLD